MTAVPEKAKPGRKPLAAGAGKTARVELRVLPDAKADWLVRATAAGLTLQAWIEKRCNAGRVKPNVATKG